MSGYLARLGLGLPRHVQRAVEGAAAKALKSQT